MSFLSDFEARIGSVFGAAPQGYTEPFSFKKLAKRAVREMENETYEIDGVDTAPALYTVLVSATDDSLMRPLYEQITYETASFVTARAQEKGYAFVGSPLVRFMVDPALKSGKFAVFAENVDAGTLARLREEERAFLAGNSSAGGAAAQVHPRGETRPAPAAGPAPAPAHVSLDGLDVDPLPVASASESTPMPVTPVAAPAPMVAPGEGPGAIPVPQTQRRSVPLVDARAVAAGMGMSAVAAGAAAAAAQPGAGSPVPDASSMPVGATCLLIDRQTGRTYTGKAPATVIGRERSQAGIVLRDPNVSRRHAELTFDGRDWYISDLGSTNGTLVNDVDIRECVLRDGDLVTLGLTNLEFRENPR